jgi:hypothetical protein
MIRSEHESIASQNPTRIVNEIESKVEVSRLVADLESRFTTRFVCIDLEGRILTRSRDQQAVIDQMTQSAQKSNGRSTGIQCTQGMFERKLEEKNMGAPLFRQITHSREEWGRPSEGL